MENNIEKLKAFTGLDSWLRLYECLEAQGLHNNKEICIKRPNRFNVTEEINAPIKADPLDTWALLVNDIKAWAFDEVFPKLPTEGQRSEIVRLLMPILFGGASARGRGHEIETFLNNLPVK